jgi:hypothetical protein
MKEFDCERAEQRANHYDAMSARNEKAAQVVGYGDVLSLRAGI